jgi:hypothetical protein
VSGLQMGLEHTSHLLNLGVGPSSGRESDTTEQSRNWNAIDKAYSNLAEPRDPQAKRRCTRSNEICPSPYMVANRGKRRARAVHCSRCEEYRMQKCLETRIRQQRNQRDSNPICSCSICGLSITGWR